MMILTIIIAALALPPAIVATVQLWRMFRPGHGLRKR